MTGSKWCWCVVAVLAFASPLAAQERTTRWSRGGGNNLWSNPLNWDNGVPDANTVALFTGNDASFALVDLGGATGRAARIDAYMGIGSRARFVNGTLSTPLVNAASGVSIESNLTTDAPVLRLEAWMDLTVTGLILGSMDVDAAGTFRGPQIYPGRTTVRSSLELADAKVFVSPVRVIPRATLMLSGESHVDDVRLHGALLRTQFPSAASTIDRLSFEAGGSQLFLEAGPFQVNMLTRSPGATVVAGGRLRANSLPPLSGAGGAPDRLPVAPWMVEILEGGHVVFDTYERSGANPGFRPLDLATEHATTLAPGANVRLTADVSQGSDVSVNTLNLSGASVTLDNATLNLSGGGLIMTGGAIERASVRGAGTLALPATEGIVHVYKPRPGDPPSGTFSIDVPITGGMLTKAGDGDLVLTRPNAYTGGTTINQGTVTAKVPGAIAAGPVRFGAGSSLRLDHAAPVVAHDIVVNSTPAPFTTLRLRPGDTTFTGTVSGDGRLYIGVGEGMGAGPLTVRLAGGGAATGTYELFLAASELIIDGNYASPDSTIFGGSRTYGTGTVRGELWNTGNTFSPGDTWGAPGRMTVGKLSSYGGTFRADLAGRDSGTGYDQLVVLDRTFLRTDPYIDSVLELALAPGFTPSVGDQFRLIDNQFTGPMDGYFQGMTEGTIFTTAGRNSWRITYAGGDGNDVVVTAVPEPAGFGLFALAGTLLCRRQRRAA